MFERGVAKVSRILEALIGLILALMVVLVFGNVVLRYGFNSGITVSEELSRYLFVWLTFLGAVVAVREHAHLGVDSLVRALPHRGKLFCAVTSQLLMLVMVGFLFRGSWTQTVINLWTRSPVSEVPLSLIYIAGLVSSAMMAVLIVGNLWHVLFADATDDELILSVESEDLAGLDQATGRFVAGPERRTGGDGPAPGGRA
jgi:TRAP-type transport system small permease protein